TRPAITSPTASRSRTATRDTAGSGQLVVCTATYARHPPNPVISRAPSTAWGSQRKPETPSPSASCTLPTPSGAGIAATNAPNPASSSAQTSTSIAPPPPAGARISPGFGGDVSSANKRYSGAVVVHVQSTAPRSVS